MTTPFVSFIISLIFHYLSFLTFSPCSILPSSWLESPSSLLNDRPSGLSQAFLMASSRAVGAAKARAVIGWGARPPPNPENLGSPPRRGDIYSTELLTVKQAVKAQLSRDSEWRPRCSVKNEIHIIQFGFSFDAQRHIGHWPGTFYF